MGFKTTSQVLGFLFFFLPASFLPTKRHIVLNLQKNDLPKTHCLEADSENS